MSLALRADADTGLPSRIPAPRVFGLPLRVGTRGSPLALVQTRDFLKLLSGFCPVLRHLGMFEEHVIRTTGDATQASGQRLADLGGKGLFAKEIHEALLDGRIDFAVHSLKDLESELPRGIVLACTLRREDPRDALLVSRSVTAEALDVPDPLAALPYGARVGTSSVRRQAQFLHRRPDLRMETIRGNVQTRLDRVNRGDYDATMLAMAGLNRLGLKPPASRPLGPEIMVPSPCQGIVGVTVRERDLALRELLAGIEEPGARIVAEAERALTGALDGSCRTPIGAFAEAEHGEVRLTGLVARVDGSFLMRLNASAPCADAARLGRDLGTELRAKSPSDVFS